MRPDPMDPAAKSPDERLDEIASIIARGILRLHGRVSAHASPAENPRPHALNSRHPPALMTSLLTLKIGDQRTAVMRDAERGTEGERAAADGRRRPQARVHRASITAR
jgi:hypothetical protein